MASGGSREPEPRISLHQGLRDLRLCRVSGTEAHSILGIEAWCGRKRRGQEAERHSQLQVKSFQKLLATAKDRRSVCKQTTKSHNALRHVLTHLSDGLRAGAGLLRFLIPFQERGSLALDLERPMPSSGQFFYSLPIQRHQQIPSGFIFFPPSLQDSSLIPSAVLTLPPKPSLAPHVNKVPFRLLDIQHLCDLLSDLKPCCSSLPHP